MIPDRPALRQLVEQIQQLQRWTIPWITVREQGTHTCGVFVSWHELAALLSDAETPAPDLQALQRRMKVRAAYLRECDSYDAAAELEVWIAEIGTAALEALPLQSADLTRLFKQLSKRVDVEIEKARRAEPSTRGITLNMLGAGIHLALSEYAAEVAALLTDAPAVRRSEHEQ